MGQFMTCPYSFRVLSDENFGAILKTWEIILKMKILTEYGI
jgi:hypothetical protein